MLPCAVVARSGPAPMRLANLGRVIRWVRGSREHSLGCPKGLLKSRGAGRLGSDLGDRALSPA